MSDEQATRPEVDVERAEKPANPVLGIAAFSFAVLLLLGNVVGIAFANHPELIEIAVTIATITIYGTIVTFLMGVVAVIANLGRAWGFAALVLSFVANPFVLLVVLGFFSGAGG